MFDYPKPVKIWNREITIPLKLTTVGNNYGGEDDEKEYLEIAADRLAGIGDVYRA